MRLHLGLIFLPQAPCPPKISTSWQPLAAREVSTAMAHNSEDKVPGPGSGSQERGKLHTSYFLGATDIEDEHSSDSSMSPKFEAK